MLWHTNYMPGIVLFTEDSGALPQGTDSTVREMGTEQKVIAQILISRIYERKVQVTMKTFIR